MGSFGPLQCAACDVLIKVGFDATDGDVMYYCKCTTCSVGDMHLDMIDGRDAVDGLDHWNAWP